MCDLWSVIVDDNASSSMSKPVEIGLHVEHRESAQHGGSTRGHTGLDLELVLGMVHPVPLHLNPSAQLLF